jgi:replicative DNA helicase
MAETKPSPAKDPSLQYVPPQNVEAEESILSAVLIDNHTLLDVLEILKPEDFYRSAHQKIFTAIAELFSKNEPVDLITLNNILKEKGFLEEVGGATYLAKLMDTAPLAVNAQHYAKIVHDKAALRRLIDNANKIARRCYEDLGDGDEVIDFAEKSIFEI